MAVVAVLLVIGVWRGPWIGPAIVLAGLLAMRAIVLLPHGPQEILAGALWIFMAALLCYFKWYVTGFFLCLSGLVYPVLLIFGQRIVTMGLSPVIADAFLILAILIAGGGVFGLGSSNTNSGGLDPSGHPTGRGGGVVAALKGSPQGD